MRLFVVMRPPSLMLVSEGRGDAPERPRPALSSILGDSRTRTSGDRILEARDAMRDAFYGGELWKNGLRRN
jgi:hypothetical protein